MRTTVDINQDLLERLRKIADDEGISFKEALNRAITRGLTPVAATTRVPYRLPNIDLSFLGDLDAKGIKALLDEEDLERYLKTQRRSPSE
jgi:hypothetical protein